MIEHGHGGELVAGYSNAEVGGRLKPVALDLCCGLGGWARGLLAAGWDVVGVDVDPRFAASYPGRFECADVRSYKPTQRFAVVVASPPCQEFSRHDQPWTRKRNPPPPDKSIWEACVRIAGTEVPLVIENVRGAQKFMGPANCHRGAFYFWGHVPPLLPRVNARQKQSMSSTWAAERAVIPFELAYAVGTWLMLCHQQVEAA